MMRLLLWTLVGLLLAALVHVCTILALPHLAGRSAQQRLAGVADDGRFLVMRAGETPLPEPDPSVVLGVCRYDLAERPVAVHVPASLGFLSVSFYTADGRTFYSLSDRAATRSGIDLTLYTAVQLADVRSRLGPDTAENLRIQAPVPRGLITIRALAGDAGEVPALEALIGRAHCRGGG